MGSNALTVATPGQDIPASHHNELVQALLQNHVPRNAARIAEDLSGQLGESALRWLRAYVQTYFIGTASANLRIEETNAGEIHILRDIDKEKIVIANGNIDFYVNNDLVGRFDSNGINGSYLESESVPKERIEPFQNPIKIFNPAVGGTAVEIVQLTYSFTAISGRYYEINVHWKSVDITSWFDTDIEGPSQPLTALYRMGPNTPSNEPGSKIHLWQAPASGVYTVKHFGLNMSGVEFQCWAKELK